MSHSAWPKRLDDNGQSLPQLVSHEYIIQLIDTPEGVPGKTKFDVRERKELTEAKALHAFDGVVFACKDLFKIPNIEFKSGIPPSDSEHRDVRHARRLLEYTVKVAENKLELKVPEFHVGIIGAGMAGLYTAMILKTLNISYEILEASNRIGGRVYTHRFSDDPGDYYDAGAMRFPDTPIMDRTFRLFTQLGIEKKPHVDFETYRAGAPPKRYQTHKREFLREQSQIHGDLIPYYIKGTNTPSYFNDHLVLVEPNPPSVAAASEDPHSFSTANGGTVPNEVEAAGAAVIEDMIFKEWREKFHNDPYPTLMKLYEKDKMAVTVRQEIMEKLKDWKSKAPDDKRTLNMSERYYISNWSETLTASTCAFDGALIESFIHSLDFNYPITPAIDPVLSAVDANKWWCLNGGADILAQEMTKNVGEHTITKNARVTAIRKHPIPSLRPMRVLVEGNPTERRFSHVVTTTTTPCLQAMDLSGVRLQTDQREALRVLRYSAAVKLGIKFSRKWWIEMGIKKGGQGKTDRPTRTVVYPSYSLEESPDSEGVLLACYNASTDATRLGALARGSDPTDQKLILNVVLHDLALMHMIPYKTLRDLVVAHHFHDWSRSEFSVGAWGDFAPGQFSNFFTCLQVPAAGGNLFFAGELTSIYHGWIVAALNSAHRAVYLMLLKERKYKLLKEMTDTWGDLTEHDVPSALCFVSLAERGEEFAGLREELAVGREKAAAEDVAKADEAKRMKALVEHAAEVYRIVEEKYNLDEDQAKYRLRR